MYQWTSATQTNVKQTNVVDKSLLKQQLWGSWENHSWHHSSSAFLCPFQSPIRWDELYFVFHVLPCSLSSCQVNPYILSLYPVNWYKEGAGSGWKMMTEKQGAFTHSFQTIEWDAKNGVEICWKMAGCDETEGWWKWKRNDRRSWGSAIPLRLCSQQPVYQPNDEGHISGIRSNVAANFSLGVGMC